MTANDIAAEGMEGLVALRRTLAETIDAEHIRNVCSTCRRTATATPPLTAQVLDVQRRIDEGLVTYEPRTGTPEMIGHEGPMPPVRSVADGFTESAPAGLAALRDLLAAEVGLRHEPGRCRSCKRTLSNLAVLSARLVDVREAINALPTAPGESWLLALQERRRTRRRSLGFPDTYEAEEVWEP